MLSRIAREAGLTPMDLYSDRGGYRNWSTDAVRWHVQQGHPVITLVKYRNLPGHTSSLSDFDHYIVISGLTPNGFIYNDGAFATTLGLWAGDLGRRARVRVGELVDSASRAGARAGAGSAGAVVPGAAAPAAVGADGGGGARCAKAGRRGRGWRGAAAPLVLTPS